MIAMILMTAVAVIIVLHKLGVTTLVRRSPAADGLMDTIVSAGLAFLFAGTFGGLVVGFGAGLVVSFWLWLVRKSAPLFDKSRATLDPDNWRKQTNA